ncbi:AAA family ATPase [Devosia sp. LjRoot16]|uniref:AAA family ATPase n=1 Tax=Devosia sp. LjRoot16 TaxID=3342271 RepID=UPI003ECE3485
MRIENLSIRNFRGIVSVDTGVLGDTIIVAGQNGSGKSCIFDAIRLLKSTYGGYQQNEFQQFFGEFQIQLNAGVQNLKGLFNDPTKPVVIQCNFALRDREKIYVQEHAAELLEESIWQTVLPEAFQYGGYSKALFSNQFRERKPEVIARVQQELPTLLNNLALPQISAAVVISPNGEVQITQSRLLTVLFTNYRPADIGVIDFHGAQRHYGRENVQGINLSLDQANQVQSQSTLYNYNNKYNNVKSEMAAGYIRQMLTEQAIGGGGEIDVSLSDAMKELFATFFPDKKFIGPRANRKGGLDFPVGTQSGSEHDLDELSAGEKEILYGYLRIRSWAPKDSIILLDEPELHLNPRLIRGLPEFYRQNLGEALSNQLWLVTHSDALIREAVGKPGYNVFHMLPSGAEGADVSQLRALTVNGDLDRVMTDLVGDLAAYRPGGKALIFEGGGDTDFDKTLVGALFAQELRGINLVSGSNKGRVRALHEILERAYERGDLPTKFFAIVDADTDGPTQDGGGVNRHVWNVYHVENYLLIDEMIASTINAIKPGATYDAQRAADRLMAAARNTVGGVLRHRLRSFANAKIVGAINLSFDPLAPAIGNELSKAIARTFERLKATVEVELTEAEVASLEEQMKGEIQQSFVDGSWRQSLPGREILKQLVDIEGLPVSYEVFRNLLVNRMVEGGVKPQGMKVIIDKVLAA